MLIFVEVGQQQNHKKHTEANYMFRKDTKMNIHVLPSSIRFSFSLCLFFSFRQCMFVALARSFFSSVTILSLAAIAADFTRHTDCTKMNFIRNVTFFLGVFLSLFHSVDWRFSARRSKGMMDVKRGRERTRKERNKYNNTHRTWRLFLLLYSSWSHHYTYYIWILCWSRLNSPLALSLSIFVSGAISTAAYNNMCAQQHIHIQAQVVGSLFLIENCFTLHNTKLNPFKAN